MFVHQSLHGSLNPAFQENPRRLGLQSRPADAHNLNSKCFGKIGDKPVNPNTRLNQTTRNEELTTCLENVQE
jgi:hypothetical protein